MFFFILYALLQTLLTVGLALALFVGLFYVCYKLEFAPRKERWFAEVMASIKK